MASAPPRTVHVGRAWRVMLKDLGLDEASLLRRADQPRGLFDGEGSHIAVADFYALHDAVEAEVGDPTVALVAGQAFSVELFDPALFAALCSANMNRAAARLGRFKQLVSAFSLDVDVGADETWLRYRCKARPDLPRLLGLTELVFLVAFVRRATRHRVVPRRVTVQQLPADLAPFEAFFGCAVQRDATWTVSLAAEDGRRPFLTHDMRMLEAFEPGLQRRMAEASRAASVRHQVEAALFELLPSGRSQMRDAAKAMGLSTRTLQRRLAAQDTTWLEVLNGTRESLARHYLHTTQMGPAEVSFLLGFDDPNSLYRAFRRWTGTTPEAWRAAASATG